MSSPTGPGVGIPVKVDADTVTVERLAAQMLDLADKVDKVTASMGRSKSAAMSWGEAFKTGFAIDFVRRGMDSLISTVESVPDRLGRAFTSMTEQSHQLEVMSARLAISTTDLQRFGEMGRPTGIGMEQIARSAAMMNRTLATNADAFKKWGINLEAMGKMTQGARFEYVLKSIRDIDSPTKQAAASMELLRDRGGRMLSLIRSDFEATANAAQNSGRILSSEMIQSAAAMRESIEQLHTDFDTFWRNLVAGASQSKVFADLLATLRDWMGQLNVWLLKNQDTVRQWVDTGILVAAHILADVFFPGVKVTVEALAALGKAFIEAQTVVKEFATASALAADTLMHPSHWRDNLALYKASVKEIEGDANKQKAALDTIAGAVGKGMDVASGAVRQFIADEEAGRHKVQEHAKTWGEAAGSAADFGNKSDAAMKKTAEAAAAATETIRRTAQALAEGFAGIAEKSMAPIDAALSKITRETQKKIEDLQASIAKTFTAKGLAIPPDVTKSVEDLVTRLHALGAAQAEQAWKDEAIKAWGESVDQAKLKLEGLTELAAHGELGTATNESLKKAAADLPAIFEGLRPIIYGGDEKAAEAALDAFTAYSAKVKDEQTKRGMHSKELLDQWRREDEAAMAAAHEYTVRQDQEQEHANALEAVFVQETAAAVANLLATVNILPGLAAGLGEGAQWADQFDQAAADGVLTLGEMVNLTAGIVAGFSKATDSASGFQRALGGAAFLGQIGSKIGSMFGPAGALIGGAVGAVVGAIGGLFHKPSWVKVGEEAGRVLGTAVSKELAQAIEKTSKQLHISVDAASLLHLDEAIKESNKDAHSFAEQIDSLMAGIANGTIPAKEGLEQVGKVWQMVADEAEKAGKVGDRVMVHMLQQARALGQYTPEMKAYVEQQMSAATAGVAKFVDSLSAVSAEVMPQLGADAGLVFAATFNALVSEKGLIAAVDEMQPAFDKLKTSLTTALGGDAAAQILAPFSAAFDMMGNEKLKPIIEGIDGLGQAMKGLANAGYLDINTFNAMERSAKTLFDEAIAGGADTHAALQAIAPTIQTAISASEQFGVPLSADMQALKDLAEQNGITFKTDPMEKAAKAMEVVAVALDKVFNLGLGVNKMFEDMGGAATDAAGAAGSIPVPRGGAPGGPAGAGAPGGRPGAEGTPKQINNDIRVDVHIAENPFQTQETQQQMRAFTLQTVQTEVSKRLADAVAAGNA